MTNTIEEVAARHRGTRRLRTLLGATITFNQGGSTVDCLIRDISESGARLAVPEQVTLPAAFELIIPHRKQRWQVQMLWRRSDVVGVQFCAAKPGNAKAVLTRDAAQKQRIRELEAEVVRLEARILQLTEG
jgi:PilZ domain